MKYGMIEQATNHVIAIIESDTVPHYPPTLDGYDVLAIPIDKDDVDLSWYYVDGEFCKENPNTDRYKMQSAIDGIRCLGLGLSEVTDTMDEYTESLLYDITMLQMDSEE